MRSWPINNRAICTRIALSFWNYITLFEKPRTRLVGKIRSQHQSIARTRNERKTVWRTSSSNRLCTAVTFHFTKIGLSRLNQSQFFLSKYRIVLGPSYLYSSIFVSSRLNPNVKSLQLDSAGSYRMFKTPNLIDPAQFVLYSTKIGLGRRNEKKRNKQNQFQKYCSRSELSQPTPRQQQFVVSIWLLAFFTNAVSISPFFPPQNSGWAGSTRKKGKKNFHILRTSCPIVTIDIFDIIRVQLFSKKIAASFRLLSFSQRPSQSDHLFSFLTQFWLSWLSLMFL